MLPSMGNTDDLILDFVEDEHEKTKTFRINNKIRLNVPKAMNATLGKLILGEAVLGNAKPDDLSNITSETVYFVNGNIDGLIALQQHILLTLSIEADQHIIYPYTYGIKTLDLIGKPRHYVMAVIKERIEDALLDDDRITGISDFQFEIHRNKIGVKFVVHSIYGDVEEETAVIY